MESLTDAYALERGCEENSITIFLRLATAVPYVVDKKV